MSSVVPGGAAEGVLEVGDEVVEVDGCVVGGADPVAPAQVAAALLGARASLVRP